MSAAVVTEHDAEPVHGLPGRLPAGETLLWQGTPGFRALALHTLHLRAFALYFAALLALRAIGTGGHGLVATLLPPAAMAGAVLALLLAYAWLLARTTVYSLTDRRVVLRFGIAVQKAVNVPFALVDGASLRLHRDGTGDIPLVLQAAGRLPYLLLWPHVRPWHLSRARPMLRAVPDAVAVAQRLSRALAAATGGHATPQAASPDTVAHDLPDGVLA